MAFDGAGSSDPDGTIVKYEWDLDGNGSFETDTGTIKTASKSYAATGDVSVKLRVTDDEGNPGESTRTVSVVAANQAPLASFTVSPAPAVVDQTVTFDGTASSDPGGTIVKYEWDLDGNGSFETDTGATKTASRSYATAGSVNVALRVTDNDGLTGQAEPHGVRERHAGGQRLRGGCAGNRGAGALLAYGRAHRRDAGRQQGRESGDDRRRREPRGARRGLRRHRHCRQLRWRRRQCRRGS